jgi:flavin-dependent dehydrogenase
LSFIGQSEKIIGEVPAAIACKRMHLDEAIARAAQQAGADLREKTPVIDAKFNKETGLWTIILEDGLTNSFQCRVLVCADGAPSKLATKLGLVTRPPDGSCSRAYIEGGTHKFKADGVIFYHTHLLPGYAALFRHPNDEVNYCVYIIPGNPQVTNDNLAHWHEFLMKKDPNITKALGNNYKIERMKAASLRLGGEPLTYSDHMLVIGDAAGMIDPMTGEGIHHAMEGGKIAAEFLGKAFEMGNFSKEVMKGYQDRWMRQFGNDYKWLVEFVGVGTDIV